LVTQIAPKRPHAADQARRPCLQSYPSRTLHSLAPAVWTKSFPNNGRQSHLFRLRKIFLGTSRMAYRAETLRRIGKVPESLTN
jgi:hypothetical protein